MLPSPEEIESAIQGLQIIQHKYKHIDTVITVLSALKSGELVDRCEMCQQSSKFEPDICEACKWNKITQGVAK